MPAETTIGKTVLRLATGDIAEQDKDAVVTAAHWRLSKGSGTDGSIHTKGGTKIYEECRKIGGCPIGDAVITTGGKSRRVRRPGLPAVFVGAFSSGCVESGCRARRSGDRQLRFVDRGLRLGRWQGRRTRPCVSCAAAATQDCRCVVSRCRHHCTTENWCICRVLQNGVSKDPTCDLLPRSMRNRNVISTNPNM